MSIKVSKNHITVFSRLFSIRWPENLRPGSFCFCFARDPSWGRRVGLLIRP